MMRAIITFQILWLLLHTVLLQGNFLVAHMVKNLPAMCETWLWSLEKGMAAHSSILAGDFHGQRSPAGYSPWGCKQLDTISDFQFFILLQGSPAPLGHRLLPIPGLLGTSLYSRRWAAGRQVKFHQFLEPLPIISITTWAPPLRSVVVLDSHGSANPSVSCHVWGI